MGRYQEKQCFDMLIRALLSLLWHFNITLLGIIFVHACVCVNNKTKFNRSASNSQRLACA